MALSGGLDATYVDSSTFTLAGQQDANGVDYTDIFTEGRSIRADCGSDDIVYSFVTSSSYDSGDDETTVNIADDVLTDNLDKIWFGVSGVEALPEHGNDQHTSDYVPEAPEDGSSYLRQDAAWTQLPDDITDISNYDTDDLSEGTSNLYHTDQRAADAAPVQEAPEDGARYTRKDGSWSQLPSDITDMSNYDTDDLSEGTSNQYFTTSRVDDYLSGGTGISYSDGTIENTDTGSDAVGTHESDYDHDDFCTGGYDIQKDGSDGNGVINFKTS